MSRKWFLVSKVIGIFFIAVGLALLASPPSPARAQCGDIPPKSSCITCHSQEDPVYGKGDWHDIHARKDCCVSCHGGNCSSMDKNLAHQGLIADPLIDTYTDCHSCHPDDYQARAERFAIVLNITPGSSPTATPIPLGPVADYPIVVLSPSSVASSGLPWPLGLGGLGAAALFLIGLGLLINHLRIH
jgi:hypothetical protein